MDRGLGITGRRSAGGRGRCARGRALAALSVSCCCHAQRLAKLWQRFLSHLATRRAQPRSAAPFGQGLSEAELRWLVEREWARTSDDVLWRRTKLGLSATPAEVRELTAYMQQRQPRPAAANKLPPSHADGAGPSPASRGLGWGSGYSAATRAGVVPSKAAAPWRTAVPSKKRGFPVPQRRTALVKVKSRKSSVEINSSSTSSQASAAPAACSAHRNGRCPSCRSPGSWRRTGELAERHRIHPVVGLAAEEVRRHEQIDPVLFLGNVAGGVIVERRDAAGQTILFLAGQPSRRSSSAAISS